MAVSACGDDSEVPSDEMPSDEAGSGTVSVAPDGTTGRVRFHANQRSGRVDALFRIHARSRPTAIGEEIRVVTPGGSDTVELSVEQPGDYQYECSFHVALVRSG